MIKVLFATLVLAFINPKAQATELFVESPAQLTQLNSGEFNLAPLAFGVDKKVVNNSELYKHSKKYQSMVLSLKEDLKNLKLKDPFLSVTMATGHRLFNIQWLSSAMAYFEWVGLVYRPDRAPFVLNSCGELRFIYRLAYSLKGQRPIYSRLPLTLNVVFKQVKEGACFVGAQSWDEFNKYLASKKYKAAALALKPFLKNLKSVEVNMQSVRWPSTVHPSMGGYAEYFLRVFQPEGSKMVLSPLENTPDVKKMNASPKLKKKLLKWLVKNQNSVDRGEYILPPEFLLSKATSVALHGVHRLANGAFTQIFKPEELVDLVYQGKKSFKSPLGFLKRVNDRSCMGCHQGRSVAGFHFLGRDLPQTEAVNSIFVSSSAHFLQDQQRRKNYYQSLLDKKTPSQERPLSVRSAEEVGGFGAHCGLGDPSFSSWTCAPGFKCVATIKDKVVSPTGYCEPIKTQAGVACEPGRIKFDSSPEKDLVVLDKKISCGVGAVCEATSVGFPGGMCSGPCEGLRTTEVCGSIALLFEFNQCLAVGQKPFADCLSQNLRPARFKKCNAQSNCRDDYICAKVNAEAGACIPPYFLFQMRVDGHPRPI